MINLKNYFYCPHCGTELFDEPIESAGTYANGDFYYCPVCGEESSSYEEYQES